MRRRQQAAGYKEVNAPQLLDKTMWETSGHWEKFRESMFVQSRRREDDRVYRDKADELSRPCADFQARSAFLSRAAGENCEFGIVHRYEPSGALHGLMRVRAFTQDDAHIFCTEERSPKKA